MKNTILKLRIIFIMGCICIALGVLMLGLNIDYWHLILWFGIFFIGFWAFIIAGNPELKDYGVERNRGKKGI